MGYLKAKQRDNGCCREVYVLRLWCEAVGSPWRLSLRPASSGKALGFGDLDELVLFLLRVMEKKDDALTNDTQRPSLCE